MSDYQKKGFLTEDFRLFHLRSNDGTRPEFHYHEFYKVLLLVSGSGSYTVEGCRYGVQSGDIVLVGSHSVHRPEIEPGRPMSGSSSTSPRNFSAGPAGPTVT